MADGRILNPDAWGFMGAVFDAKNAATEGPVQGLWTSVLALLFPQVPTAASPNAAYRVSIKSAGLATSHEAGVRIMEHRMTGNPTQPRNSTDLQQRQIFIGKCKDAGSDTSSRWEEAEVQLAQYLEQNIKGSGRFYAAIGVGTKVIFYKWDQSKGPNYKDQMTAMHLGPLDFSTPAHRRTIEEYLEQIRNDGWNRSLT